MQQFSRQKVPENQLFLLPCAHGPVPELIEHPAQRRKGRRQAILQTAEGPGTHGQQDVARQEYGGQHPKHRRHLPPGMDTGLRRLERVFRSHSMAAKDMTHMTIGGQGGHVDEGDKEQLAGEGG